MRRRIGDLDIAYEKDGTGPPLVLLHGSGADLIWWEDMVPHLATEFTVYRYDQRGFGQTVRPKEPKLSLAQWTADLLAFVDAFELEKPTLVGWSLGASVILDFAADHSDRCGVVIPIGSPGPERVVQDKSGFEMRQRLADSGASVEEIIDATFDFTEAAFSQWSREHNPQAVQKMRATLLRNSPSDYSEMVDAFDELSDFGPKLPVVKARVLIICGAEDGRTPPYLAEELHKALPSSQLVMLPDCGHYYSFEKPEETSRLIREFLASG